MIKSCRGKANNASRLMIWSLGLHQMSSNQTWKGKYGYYIRQRDLYCVNTNQEELKDSPEKHLSRVCTSWQLPVYNATENRKKFLGSVFWSSNSFKGCWNCLTKKSTLFSLLSADISAANIEGDLQSNWWKASNGVPNAVRSTLDYRCRNIEIKNNYRSTHTFVDVEMDNSPLNANLISLRHFFQIKTERKARKLKLKCRYVPHENQYKENCEVHAGSSISQFLVRRLVLSLAVV